MSESNFSIVKKWKLKKCRTMVCGTIPFAMMFSMPFVLVVSYYNTQNQAPFRKWNVKLFGRDILIGWAFFITYATVRTFVMDPYCDPNSVHYDRELNAFERKKRIIGELKETLKKEGKL